MTKAKAKQEVAELEPITEAEANADAEGEEQEPENFEEKFYSLERHYKKSMRRANRNIRHSRAHGFLEGVLALLQPGDLVIDCGANIGEVSAQLVQTGAHVVAFEPDPFAFKLIKQRFARNKNFQAFQQAVSTSDGHVELMRAPNVNENEFGGSVKSTIMQGGRGVSEKAATESFTVEQIDFVAFLKETIESHGPIAFIKMDIEGSELDLLEKMDKADLFSSIRCTVVETHERKFKELRPRFKELRDNFGSKYASNHVNLDWI